MNTLLCSTVKTADWKAEERSSPVTVYHGSENVVEKPVFGFGKRTNDYGLGFYCTEDQTLAGLYMLNILQERIRPDDPRLQ